MLETRKDTTTAPRPNTRGKAGVFLSALSLAACATAPTHTEAPLRAAQAESIFRLHEDSSVPAHARVNDGTTSIIILRDGSNLYQIQTADDNNGRVLAIRSCRANREEIGQLQTCPDNEGIEVMDMKVDGRPEALRIGTTVIYPGINDTDSLRAAQNTYDRQLDAVSAYIRTRGGNQL